MDVIDYYIPIEKIKKERHLTLIIFIPTLLIIITLLCLLVIKENNLCYTEECEKSAKYLYNFVDESKRPCDNFYEYACGSLLKNKRNTNFTNMVDLERQRVRMHLENSIQGPILNGDSNSIILQKQFYQSCMNLSAIEMDNNTVILRIFKELGGWPVLESKYWNEKDFDVFDMMIKTRKKGDYYQWFLDISAEKEYHDHLKREMIRVDLPSVNNMEANFIPEYLEILVDIAVTLGARKQQAVTDMKYLIMFEKELAQVVEEVQRLDTNHPVVLTIDSIKTTWPKIYWLMFLSNITQTTLTNHDRVLFTVGNYLPKLGTLLQKTDKRTQANYILWKILESYTPYLTKSIREKINLYRQKLQGSLNKDSIEAGRNTFCFQETMSFFRYVSEADFARKQASKEKRNEVKEMLENICCATRKAILNCQWMDEETKEKALIKLGKVRYIIGAPKEVFDEKEFDKLIGVNRIKYYSNNIIEMNRELYRRLADYNFDLEKPKITLEKIKFYSAIPSVNAEFLMDTNTILIPAGIFEDEFYSSKRQNYLNYGTLGVILAHEMAHGFGIEGSTYIDGNKTTNWWSSKSKSNFFKSVECLLENCTNGMTDMNNVDCKSTLDENFADYTSIKLALEAYQEWVNKYGEETSLSGFRYDDPHQLFFTKYATMMCYQKSSNQNEDTRHLLPSQRILGSYRNSPYFSKTFYCPEQSSMNPRDKCIVF